MKEYTVSISYQIDIIAGDEQSAINNAVNKIREHKLISKLLVHVVDKRELAKSITEETTDDQESTQ